MTKRRASPARAVPQSLAGVRFLSPRARTAWRRDLVFCQIEEINALYDAVVLEATDREGSATATARARVRALQRAASFVPESSLTAARSFIETEIEGLADMLGPAVILETLSGDEPSVKKWLAELPSEVRTVLRIVQDGT